MKNSRTNSIKYSLVGILLAGVIFITGCTNEQGKEATATDSEAAPTVSIHEAAFFGNVDAIKGHIAAKTDLNVKDEYGSAPLSIAATFGKTDVALALISGGADITVTSADGSTPLHTAAFFCRKEIVEALLNAGADTSARNHFGSTALESVSAPFENVKMIYDQIGKDLGPFGLKLDYEQIQKTRPVLVEMLSK